jgi:hypothetical protein
VVEACITAGLVGGEGFAVDASLIMADANKQRWFVPSEELPTFVERWRNEIKPAILRQPGCLRVEIFESSIRGHWVTSVLWQDQASRMNALTQLAPLSTEFGQYERFEPEILTLHSE